MILSGIRLVIIINWVILRHLLFVNVENSLGMRLPNPDITENGHPIPGLPYDFS